MFFVIVGLMMPGCYKPIRSETTRSQPYQR